MSWPACTREDVAAIQALEWRPFDRVWKCKLPRETNWVQAEHHPSLSGVHASVVQAWITMLENKVKQGGGA